MDISGDCVCGPKENFLNVKLEVQKLSYKITNHRLELRCPLENREWNQISMKIPLSDKYLWVFDKKNHNSNFFQLNPLFVFISSHFCFSISAEEVSGPMLKLWKVSRMDMGAYMCIARNGVPPAVSKRIELGIDCKFNDKLQCRVSFTQKMNTSWVGMKLETTVVILT